MPAPRPRHPKPNVAYSPRHTRAMPAPVSCSPCSPCYPSPCGTCPWPPPPVPGMFGGTGHWRGYGAGVARAIGIFFGLGYARAWRGHVLFPQACSGASLESSESKYVQEVVHATDGDWPAPAKQQSGCRWVFWVRWSGSKDPAADSVVGWTAAGWGRGHPTARFTVAPSVCRRACPGGAFKVRTHISGKYGVDE
eukprot:gene8564-biopygen10660